MNRYDIALKKPAPKRPKPASEKKVEQTGKGLSQARKQEIIREYMSTAVGRERLAASMVEPFRHQLNIRSFARRIFNIDRLPVGSLPIYDKDANAICYTISEEGQNVLEISQPRRVIIPTFDIRSIQRVGLTELREVASDRNPNLVERVIEGALQDFVAEEEGGVIELLNALTTATNEIISINSMDNFGTHTLTDAMARIERLDLRVANILINSQDYLRVRDRISREYLDIGTHRELIQSGLVATIFGAQINTSSNVPTGQIYFLPEPEFAGILPERYFGCLNADDPVMRQVGFSFMEQIGMGCLDSRRIVRISIGD